MNETYDRGGGEAARLAGRNVRPFLEPSYGATPQILPDISPLNRAETPHEELRSSHAKYGPERLRLPEADKNLPLPLTIFALFPLL